MPNKIKAKDITLHYDSSGYVAITALIDVTLPEISGSDISITALASTAEERMSGLASTGELEASVYYDPDDTSHAFLTTQAATSYQTSRNWKVTLTDGTPTTWISSGYVKSFAVETAVNNTVLIGKLKVACTGVPTIA